MERLEGAGLPLSILMRGLGVVDWLAGRRWFVVLSGPVLSDLTWRFFLALFLFFAFFFWCIEDRQTSANHDRREQEKGFISLRPL